MQFYCKWLILPFFSLGTCVNAVAALPFGTEICVAANDGSGRNVGSRIKLMRSLVQKSWPSGGRISERAIDLNDDGTSSYEERLEAITSSEHCIENSDRCSQSDGDSIFDIHDQLDDFSLGKSEKFDIRFSSTDAQNSWEDLESNQRLRVILTKGSPVEIVCIAKIKKPPHKPYNPILAETVPDRGFRLSGKRVDLGKQRTKKNIRSLSPARFSVSTDFDTNNSTWLVEGYAGYKIGWITDEWSGFFLPFVHTVQKDTGNANTTVDKIGVGFDVGATSLAIGEIIAGGMYLTDSSLGADIGTLSAVWWPTIPGITTGQYFNSFDPLGQGLEMKLTARALLDASHVFQVGKTTQLTEGETYVLLGGAGRVRIRGVPNSTFKDFLLDIDARYLYGVSGTVDEMYRVDSSLNYFFPGQDHFSIGLTYGYGHQEDTFEFEHALELVFGARF